MYVVVLDVEADQAAEREALNLLSIVVARPDQALEAWSVILRVIADSSQRRMGTKEMDIRAGLESAGTLLKCPPRYESDIAKLRSCSRDTLRYLAHHSQIGVAGCRSVLAAMW